MKTKSVVLSPAASKVWIFQAVPEQYDISIKIPELIGPGEKSDDWLVTQHWDEMQVGQCVLLWRSGPDGGIYGTGTLTSRPYKSGKTRVVDVKFDPLLKHPLLKDALSKHPVLKKLSILRMPRGTNFPVTEDQWKALRSMLGERQTESEREIFALESQFCDFNPKNQRDARRLIVASIVLRQGQPEFRRKLLKIYGKKCPVTGCDAESALEAAHICGYKGSHTNHPGNGLILRSDLHALFDLFLLTIDAATKRMILSPALRDTVYREFENKKLKFPKNGPSFKALEWHQAEFERRLKVI